MCHEALADSVTVLYLMGVVKRHVPIVVMAPRNLNVSGGFTLPNERIRFKFCAVEERFLGRLITFRRRFESGPRSQVYRA